MATKIEVLEKEVLLCEQDHLNEMSIAQIRKKSIFDRAILYTKDIRKLEL